MTSHPFVTVYRSRDGGWYGTYMKPVPGKPMVRVRLLKLGVKTASARAAWAEKKSEDLAVAWAARMTGKRRPT